MAEKFVKTQVVCEVVDVYKRYYSGYDDCIAEMQEEVPCTCKQENCKSECATCVSEKKIFANLAADDILLLCIFLFLIMEQCEDRLMLVIIGFVLLSGMGEQLN